MTKSKTDLTALLAFTDSTTGEAAIAELGQQLRDSESELASHKARYDAAALKSDAALAKHLEDAALMERTSARLSVAIEHARKRLADVRQTEVQQAGAKARAAALELVDEAAALLRGLFEMASRTGEIVNRLARWRSVEEEVIRLNEVAVAGGADRVALPELLDDQELAATEGAEAAQKLGEFLKDAAYSVSQRKWRAQRAAEAAAKKLAELPTEEEAKALEAKGFDPKIISREARDPEEGYRQHLVRQEIRFMRGHGRGAPAHTNAI